MQLSGRSLIGSQEISSGANSFRAFSPAAGEMIEPEFYSATSEQVDQSVLLAHEAFSVYGQVKGVSRANFLRKIADKMESIKDALIERAHQETALPLGRLRGEVERTCYQLHFFADLVEEGSWVMPHIDLADPNRKPTPKPDIRSMLRGIGPVVVFGASNFPFAFSVAGGDTASALAAGNPVIVKGHPAHPGTSEAVGKVICESAHECQLPEGVFSLLFDSDKTVGVQLLQHPLVKAASFTGSHAAGRRLWELAANRPEPIPFYGEMASTNPLFILPEAMAAAGEKIAADLYSSFTLGAGQFCTKPGLVFVSEGKPTQTFLARLREKVSGSTPFALLTPAIAEAYHREIRERRQQAGLRCFSHSKSSARTSGAEASAALFETDAATFLANCTLASEHFGPSTLVIAYSNKLQMLACAKHLSGHLTATIHGTLTEVQQHVDLIRILETRVGRIVFNGFPTGVEVCHGMVHGGPYPASTDARITSVGSAAILRFARPVCYQSCPELGLPPELQSSNPLGLWRLVDGHFTKEPVNGGCVG
jgi:2,5-dioxopentanoate dehydrogenase